MGARRHRGVFHHAPCRTRCELAAYELANTDRPVHEIIADMGYQNEGHFRKMFFAVYHKTPLAYRKAEQSGKK